MVFLAGVIPSTLISPLAGAMVDRWNRRSVMMACDLALALNTLGLIWLFSTGRLEIWHTYVAVAIASFANALSMAGLLDPGPPVGLEKEFWPRQWDDSGRRGPRAAHCAGRGRDPGCDDSDPGRPYHRLCDVSVPLITLSLVRVPTAAGAIGGDAEKRALFREAVDGWSYIAARPGLLGLMVLRNQQSFRRCGGSTGSAADPELRLANPTRARALDRRLRNAGRERPDECLGRSQAARVR